MKFNPANEVSYRARLAARYLEEAEDALRRRDYRGAVASSQLSTENSAKAVIALFSIPSWSHDPSHELLEVLHMLPENMRRLAEELAEIARQLAPEHGRTTYGEPVKRLTPWDIYDEESASEALSKATRAQEIMNMILSKMRT
ncbi:MAG: HEPN domain-containing protein [Candidatus Jordarchaeales archaeon]|nr:HEPN domain-containing protein [Candidatus Jordarchaeia archaeon]